jgi:hypothetical protein
MSDARPTAPPPGEVLTQLIFGKWVAMAVSAVARLRIADRLATGPKTLTELARETETHAPSLYRLMRAVASVGVFEETADGRFQINPVGELLRTGVAGSLRGVADYCGAEWSWKTWGHLLDSVRTGKTAFDLVYGEPLFDYLAKHPDESEVFNEGMTGFSSTIAPAVAEAYDFGQFKTVVDVGGGHGEVLRHILTQHPTVRGVVFDAPHVARGAVAAIRAAGLADQCRAEGGDFFQAVPAGGDAYLMKHIIHDWADERATTILKNCRKAVNPGGKLLLIELVIPAGNEPSPGKLLDLEMLLLPGGKERTEAEYAALLAGAGWKLTRVIPTKSPAQLVEAIPV